MCNIITESANKRKKKKRYEQRHVIFVNLYKTGQFFKKKIPNIPQLSQY
jgi:hypothetical protein